MNDSAIFQFNTIANLKPVCCYLAFDGHPKNAAIYFTKMHEYKQGAGDYIEQFVRANLNVQLILSVADQPKAKYKYTLENNGLMQVEERASNKEVPWQKIFTGDWCAFVNKYLCLNEEDCLYKFPEGGYFDNHGVMSFSEALEAVREEFNFGAKMANNLSGYIDALNAGKRALNILEKIHQILEIKSKPI